MYIKELTIEEFNEFQSNHQLTSYYQTINYAILMSEMGYDYDIIGYTDGSKIYAASLILIKDIAGKYYYGYAPRGFLIDYNNEVLVEHFTQDLKKYYYQKKFAFIKVNPNVVIGTLNEELMEIEKDDYTTTSLLINNGYKKLRDNLYFEAMLPRFNAYIDLKSFDSQNLEKNTKNKIKKGIRKGLKFELVSKDNINIFYNFIKNKEHHSEFFYKDYFTAFEKNNNIDLFLVSIDYNAFLQNSQYLYNEELERNAIFNEKLTKNSTSEKILNKKMQSDKNLLTYKNDIMEATKGLNNIDKVYLAGALVVKHQDTVSIIMSGYDIFYKRFAPNYFLHYSLIKYYQDQFKYLDLNGIVGEFKEINNYTGLNNFKLSFKPKVYEFIGEFDLIIEPKLYQTLLNNGYLAKEFNKK